LIPIELRLFELLLIECKLFLQSSDCFLVLLIYR